MPSLFSALRGRFSRSGVCDRITPRQRELHDNFSRGPYFHGPVHVPRFLVCPWNTNESGEVEAQATRRRYEQTQRETPFRGLQVSAGSDQGLHWSRERPFPPRLSWIARLVKRNTLYFSGYFQFGLSLGFVHRWKVVYADTWIQSMSRLTGEHPINIAEKYVAEGREIVSTREKAGSV